MTARGKPMLFTGPMVRALIEGRKTQTRRVLEPLPRRTIFFDPGTAGREQFRDAGFDVGDRIWVRETWTAQMDHGWTVADARSRMHNEHILYRADGHDSSDGWWPSIHMPREFSRLTLIVTGLRVQRLQEISEADAIAEGIREQPFTGWFSVPGLNGAGTTARAAYSMLWNSLNAKRAPWESNPWVVALTFAVHRCNIDQMEAPQ